MTLSRRLMLSAAAAAALTVSLPAFAVDKTVTVKTLNGKNQLIDITVPANPKRIAVAEAHRPHCGSDPDDASGIPPAVL